MSREDVWERGYRPAPKYTLDEVRDAVVGSGGNKSEIARRLAATRPTVYHWLKKPEIAKVYAAERERDRQRRRAAAAEAWSD